MNIEYIEKNTDMKVEYHETISSTSERAKEIAEERVHTFFNMRKDACNSKDVEQKMSENLEKDFAKIQVVISENQIRGKGTNGRIWYSNAGENILMTLIFYPQNTIEELQKVTYSIAKMIQSAIKDLYGISLEIKLPNDLLLNSKKVCGILTESSIQNEKVNYLLIGIGLNVNQLEFPNELQEIATSLKKEHPEIEMTREEIVVKIINRVKSLVK